MLCNTSCPVTAELTQPYVQVPWVPLGVCFDVQHVIGWAFLASFFSFMFPLFSVHLCKIQLIEIACCQTMRGPLTGIYR